MPCTDFGGGPGYGPSYESDWREATKAACDLARVWRAGGAWDDLKFQTRSWVQRHDEADRERLRREEEAETRQRKKRLAMDKLTPEERKLLGIS